MYKIWKVDSTFFSLHQPDVFEYIATYVLVHKMIVRLMSQRLSKFRGGMIA